jgi:hypothetical protein
MIWSVHIPVPLERRGKERSDAFISRIRYARTCNANELQRPPPKDGLLETDTRYTHPHRQSLAETIQKTVDTSPSVGSQTVIVDEPPIQRSPVNGFREAAQDAIVTVEGYKCQSQAVRRRTANHVDSRARSFEFYGPSSSVAFLTHIDTLSRGRTTDDEEGQPNLPEFPTLQTLHKTVYLSAFQNLASPSETLPDSDQYHFRIARRFLDAYFSAIHTIEPLFEEEAFLARCEDLWFGRREAQPLSFVGLYYATLALGCLVMTIDDGVEIAGESRFAWSRRLFDKSVATINSLGTTTDLETAQCFYMLVSQIDGHFTTLKR